MAEPGWSRVEIAGKPADAFDPPGAVRGAVAFLHPYGLESQADNRAYSDAFARHGLAVCAPFGGHSWWVDRVCPEFDPVMTAERFLLDSVRPWMLDRWRVAKVAAAGISMGGQGAVRLGFRHSKAFPVVGSVAGAFDFHERWGRGTELDELYPSAEAARLDTAVTHVNPAAFPPHVWFACDPTDADWIRGNDRLFEKLTAFGLPHVCDLETSAGGHSWSYFDAMAEPLAAWIAKSLAADSRRLL